MLRTILSLISYFFSSYYVFAPFVAATSKVGKISYEPSSYVKTSENYEQNKAESLLDTRAQLNSRLFNKLSAEYESGNDNDYKTNADISKSSFYEDYTLVSDKALTAGRYGSYFEDTGSKSTSTEQKVGTIAGAAPFAMNLVINGKTMLEAASEGKTWTAATAGLQALSAFCFIGGTVSMATGMVPLAVGFYVVGAGLGILGAFLPKDKAPNPWAQADKEFKILKTMLGYLTVQVDKILLKLDDITNMLKELAVRMQEMSGKLDLLIKTVEETQLIMKFENRIKRILGYKHELVLADEYFRRVQNKRDDASMKLFLNQCDVVEDYPINIRLFFVNDTEDLKKTAIQRDKENAYNETQYVEYALTIMTVLYHSLHMTTICISLKNVNQTEEIRKSLQENLLQDAREHVTLIQAQYDEDRFLSYQPFLDIIRYEAEKDNGESSPEKFSELIFQKLRKISSSAKMLFFTWEDQLANKSETFYPYRSNDKSVDIVHKLTDNTNTYSFVHYWLGQWNRNMVLYVRGKYQIDPLWEMNVDERISELFEHWDSYKQEDPDCDTFFKVLNKSAKHFENPAIGCISGPNMFQQNLEKGKYVATYPSDEFTVYVIA